MHLNRNVKFKLTASKGALEMDGYFHNTQRYNSTKSIKEIAKSQPGKKGSSTNDAAKYALKTHYPSSEIYMKGLVLISERRSPKNLEAEYSLPKTVETVFRHQKLNMKIFAAPPGDSPIGCGVILILIKSERFYKLAVPITGRDLNNHCVYEVFRRSLKIFSYKI